MQRRAIQSSAMLALVALGGCTLVGSSPAGEAPAPEAGEPVPARELPMVDGRWTGFISVEGQGVNGTLDLTQEGPTLQGTFDAPDFGMVAEGGGTIDLEGRVELRLSYNLQCAGSAELVGRRSSDGAVIDGTLTASDCTGSSEGSFTFRR